MKRTRAKGKDVFPNYMAGVVTESSADTFTTVELSTPIPRMLQGTRATIMELLWIEFEPTAVTLNNAGEMVRGMVSGGAAPAALLHLDDGNLVANYSIRFQMLTSGAGIFQGPIVHNLQSRDGHGFLYGGDKIHISIQGTATGVTNGVYVRIYYRFVDVAVTEYIGIVQSFQQ